MKIATTAPLHLSNYEVLTHFLDLKADNDALKARITSRSDRKKAAAFEKYPPAAEEHWLIPESQGGQAAEPPVLSELTEKEGKLEDEAERRGTSNELVWVQNEVLRYLCSSHSRTSRQSSEGVARLADELQDHELTKAEVLQLCNLAPTDRAALYCIIEDSDKRFGESGDRLELIGQQIGSTLRSSVPPELAALGQPPGTEGDGVGPSETDGEAGANALGGARGVMTEEEFVHEAEWGRDREQAVDDDVADDME